MWESLGALLKFVRRALPLLTCLFGDVQGADEHEQGTVNNYTYVYINEDIPGEKNNNLYYLMAELG